MTYCTNVKQMVSLLSCCNYITSCCMADI